MSDPQNLFRLPPSRSVDRVSFLSGLARNRRVIHVGFWGTEGIREGMEADGLWLHARLAASARELVGIDVNPRGVQEAQRRGYEAHQIDCCDARALAAATIPPAELVIAGEIIEHLETPGPFLDAMHVLVGAGGHLVVTTPNAHSLSSLLMTVAGREAINPDHVALYSWYTLTTMLRRHGWDTRWAGAYDYPHARTIRGALLFGLERAAGSWNAFLSSGLIVVSAPSAR
jgi:hypothetical protein